jgi:hypothetical protein
MACIHLTCPILPSGGVLPWLAILARSGMRWDERACVSRQGCGSEAWPSRDTPSGQRMEGYHEAKEGSGR